MSEKSETTCDGCGRKDVDRTGNSIDYYIELGNARSRSWGGAVTDAMIYPPIEGGTKHFCGVGCLCKWAQKTYPSQFAAQEKDK